MRKRLVGVAVMLVAAMALTACGKTNEADNATKVENESTGEIVASTENIDGSVVDVVGDNQGSDVVNNVTKEDSNSSLAVYLIGEDTVHFCVESDLLETVASKQEYEDGESSLVVFFEKTENDTEPCQFSGDSSYATYGYSDGNEWVSVDSNNSGEYMCMSNIYMATFNDARVKGSLADGMTYKVYIVDRSNWSINDSTLAFTGTLKINSISNEEFVEVKNNEMIKLKAINEPHDIWAGNFLTDRYIYRDDYSEDINGYATVEITDAGAIVVSVTERENSQLFVFEETEYDLASYDYGDIISATATVPGGRNGRICLSYHGEEDYTNYTLEVSDYINGTSDSYTFNKYEDTLEAPADYKDEDKYGHIDYIKDSVNKMLSVPTDDYIIAYTMDNAYMYNGDSYDELVCDRYEVNAFDVNGIDVWTGYVYAFEDEETANKYHKYLSENGYSSPKKDGKIVVDAVDYSSYYQEKDYILNSYYGVDYYDGTHYAFKSKSYIEDDETTIYVSKPREKCDINFEMAGELSLIKSGTHRSIDDKDGYMGYSFSYYSEDKTPRISVYSYGTDFRYGDTGMRFIDGRHLVTIGYESYEEIVIVKEYELGDEEATVTQYLFEEKDFSNISITYDNYKDAKPKSTTTHRYDMTRSE